MNKVLEKYIPIAEFISAIMGENCEVVVQDATNPGQSIVWIDKGHLSGRKIGDPLTDLSLDFLTCEQCKTNHFAVNYEGLGLNNKKFVSSTFCIKDEEDVIQGFLCVNNDISNFLEVKKQFELMEKYFIKPNHDYKETISNQVSTLARDISSETISKWNIPVNRMKKAEKIEIVRELSEKGICDIKGGISEAAKLLGISETTFYRYLKEI